jgi:prepilin-type N-terminal cleavage/methylation domain-containing protein
MCLRLATAQGRLTNMTQDPSPQRRSPRLLPPTSHLSGGPGPVRVGDESAFTMIELVVTMAILLVIFSALTGVVVSATRTETRTKMAVQAQDDGRVALDSLRRELHCASAVSVVNGSGQAVAAGTAGNGIYATVGGYCPSNGLTADAAATVKVTWCTLASTVTTGDYALYRLASLSTQPTCATTGKKLVDNLATATPFCLPSTSTACGGVLKSANSLPTVHLTLQVSPNGPSSTAGRFNVTDDITIRNGTRS